jgi:alkyl hydroperoxide reductase subunit AhpF
VDAAFVDLGLVANSDFVRAIVHTDEHGFIKINERNATLVPGLFAAGDVTNVAVEQKLIAVGEGAKAAVNAYDYILWRRWARPR